jgi:hypothetical protein
MGYILSTAMLRSLPPSIHGIAITAVEQFLATVGKLVVPDLGVSHDLQASLSFKSKKSMV